MTTNPTLRRASVNAAANSTRERGTGRCVMEAMEGREMFSVTDWIIDPIPFKAPATTTVAPTTLTAEGRTSAAGRYLVIAIKDGPT